MVFWQTWLIGVMASYRISDSNYQTVRRLVICRVLPERTCATLYSTVWVIFILVVACRLSGAKPSPRQMLTNQNSLRQIAQCANELGRKCFFSNGSSHISAPSHTWANAYLSSIGSTKPHCAVHRGSESKFGFGAGLASVRRQAIT